MIPLDELAPSYRRAKDRWPTAPTLVAHYHTVAEAYVGTEQALIESVKSFLECVCRTILVEYGGQVGVQPSTTELLGLALDRLGLRNERGASKFDKVLSAHNKLAEALNDCRNLDGAIAHGKDGFLDALATHHVRLYVLTGDTILSLLLGAIDGKQPDLKQTREPHGRFAHFNDAMNAAVGVTASVDEDEGTVVLTFTTGSHREGVEVRAVPSLLLYQLDRGAYVEVLASIPHALDVVDSSAGKGDDVLLPEFSSVSATMIDARLVPTYDGHFAHLEADLHAFMASRGVSLPSRSAKHVVPSLLATFEKTETLDWAERPAMRARVLVAFKHVLRAARVTSPGSEELAQALVEWFARPSRAKKGAANVAARSRRG